MAQLNAPNNNTANAANAALAAVKSKKSKYLGLAGIVALALWVMSGYNSLVNKDEAVNQAWANVQSSYQRRADLIPNLVKMIKNYTNYESGTLEAVVNARSKATQMKLDPNDLTEEKLKEFQASQNELGAALGRLLAISEAYPDLKASKQFEQFNVQLEGTENRIKESRDHFNAAVKEFNIKVRRFPNSLIAGIFGFEKKAMFEADAGAEKAPEIEEF